MIEKSVVKSILLLRDWCRGGKAAIYELGADEIA